MRLIWRDFHVNLSDFLDQATGNVHRSVINRTERQAPRYNFRRYFELNPVMPLGMLFIICAIIFVLLIFRRWPGVVAGIIAGTLTSVSVYFLLLALRIDKSVYEYSNNNNFEKKGEPPYHFKILPMAASITKQGNFIHNTLNKGNMSKALDFVEQRLFDQTRIECIKPNRIEKIHKTVDEK